MIGIVTLLVGVVCAGTIMAQSARDHAIECHPVRSNGTGTWLVSVDRSTYHAPSLSAAVKGPGDADWLDVPVWRDTTSDTLVSVPMPYPTTELRLRVLRADTLPADGYARIVTSAAARGPNAARVCIIADAAAATALAPELQRFRDDLRREGWSTTLTTVAPSNDPRDAPAVRRLIRSIYRSDHPAPLTHVVLVGAIPTPYAGGFRVGTVAEPPDGHPEHGGAWASDAYYADMDLSPGIDAEEAWTDATVNITDTAVAYWERNRNVPGDGKFDQVTVPTDVELAVGRIDMRDMPAFGSTATDRTTEFVLLRRYFDKDHRYRITGRAVPHRAVIDDNFGAFTYVEQGLLVREAFASSAWRSFAPIMDTIIPGDWMPETPDRPSLDTLQSLFTYACGGGGFTHCSYVATTDQLVASPLRSVFTMLFGSYFGDVAAPDNIMRATIANNGDALTCVWSGRPHWFLHPMAAGATIGDCLMLAVNNDGTYRGATQRPTDGTSIAPFRLGQRGVHVQVVGDPTLRLPGPTLTTFELPDVAMVGAKNVRVVLAADDAVVVDLSMGPTPDGPWTTLAEGLAIPNGVRTEATIDGPITERFVRAMVMQPMAQVHGRTWFNVTGRGALLELQPASSVHEEPMHRSQRTYYDLLGRTSSHGTIPAAPGLYVWRSADGVGKVVVP